MKSHIRNLTMSTSYHAPEFKNLTRLAIQKLASEFSTKIDYKPRQDLIPIIKNQLQSTVEFVEDDELQNTNDGSIIVDGPDDMRISLTKYNGPLRDRFTLAHELGHYVIHSEYGKIPLKADRYGRSGAEWEANMFAAELLMPEREFRTEMQTSEDSQYLAAKFLVSITAANVRKDILNKY